MTDICKHCSRCGAHLYFHWCHHCCHNPPEHETVFIDLSDPKISWSDLLEPIVSPPQPPTDPKILN